MMIAMWLALPWVFFRLRKLKGWSCELDILDRDTILRSDSPAYVTCFVTT